MKALLRNLLDFDFHKRASATKALTHKLFQLDLEKIRAVGPKSAFEKTNSTFGKTKDERAEIEIPKRNRA